MAMAPWAGDGLVCGEDDMGSAWEDRGSIRCCFWCYSMWDTMASGLMDLLGFLEAIPK